MRLTGDAAEAARGRDDLANPKRLETKCQEFLKEFPKRESVFEGQIAKAKKDLEGLATALTGVNAEIGLAENRKPKMPKKAPQKVKDAIEKVGYRQNKMARSLVTGKTNTVGVIIPDISNPFFAFFRKVFELPAQLC